MSGTPRRKEFDDDQSNEKRGLPEIGDPQEQDGGDEGTRGGQDHKALGGKLACLQDGQAVCEELRREVDFSACLRLRA